MKNIKYSIIALIAASTLNSCTADFEEINTDPNRLETISPASLLNPILYGLTNHNSYSAWHNRTAHLMQGIVPYPSNDALGYHRYWVTDAIGQTMWNNHYRWLKNIVEMEQAAIAANDVNYQAIALTLKAWSFANLTDVFGDIPFEEALQGDQGITKPKFQSQQVIYEAVLGYLEEANALYDTSKPLIYAPDLLYGDRGPQAVANWQKLTNSLHLRMLLRLSDVQPSESIAKINTMLNDGGTYPIFTSSADDAILINTGVSPNTTPWPRIQDYASNKRLSTFFVDTLLAWNDPRLPFWATQATNLDKEPIGYKGIDSGYSFESYIDYTPSSPNNNTALAPMKNIVMTYSEVAFIQSELAFKGLISGDAESLYKQGVEAAMAIWNIDLPSDYFENEDVVFNNSLEQIMLQKYFALYFTDNQQWLEYRRTGYPLLPKHPDLFNNGDMPVRYPYPQDVKRQNTENYQDAVNNMGGDDINTRVWWDIK
nr:SusD/RagB family nutrient-binding outer membrane lipoprotein [uncultured Flavobacterium sp.]